MNLLGVLARSSQFVPADILFRNVIQKESINKINSSNILKKYSGLYYMKFKEKSK